MRYVFKAIDRSGRVITGQMEADAPQAVVSHLHRVGSLPMDIRPAEVSTSGPAMLSWERVFGRRSEGLSLRTLADWCEQLAELLTAGMPLDSALSILASGASDPALRVLTRHIQDDVRAGAHLTQAVVQNIPQLPPLFAPMLRAAELAGALPAALASLGAELHQTLRTREALWAAMTYPVVLLVVTLLSLVAIITVVLPALATMFSDLHATLPLVTRATLWLGEQARTWGPLIAALGVGTGVATWRAFQAPDRRRRRDRALLNIPGLRRWLVDRMTMRFCQVLGMLLQHGVTIDHALPVAIQSLGNLHAAACLTRAAERIKQGASLSQALQAHAPFSSETFQMLRIGEESGTLAVMLVKVAGRCERAAQHRLRVLLTVLQPALILGLAVVIGVIISALLMAILSINDLAL